MINILINGCNGKMGQEVANQVIKSEKMTTICGVDRLISETTTFPIYNEIEKIKETPDVIIDFSIVESTFKILDYAKKYRIPIVIATTGFSEEENQKIIEFSKHIPIFKSANMSYEINLMSRLVAQMANLLKDSDIEIVETHHNRKLDSPSGTAYLLANSINTALGNEMVYKYDRHSKKEQRNKKEIGIHSIRGGTEVGKHSVLFFSDNESFEITHTVNSRSVFAKGALKAAEFILDKENGFYTMDNMF